MTTPSPDRGAVLKTLGPEHFDRARVMLAYERVETVVAELIATIDFLEARALPLPRRYTGGPLEDGLYLWRRPWWPKMAWSSFGQADGFIRVGSDPIPPASASEWVWLIGPITIPDLPSEEASS